MYSVWKFRNKNDWTVFLNIYFSAENIKCGSVWLLSLKLFSGLYDVSWFLSNNLESNKQWYLGVVPHILQFSVKCFARQSIAYLSASFTATTTEIVLGFLHSANFCVDQLFTISSIFFFANYLFFFLLSDRKISARLRKY